MGIRTEKILDHCIHCGRALGPWERVLLSVDRALKCKACGFLILLDANDQPIEAFPAFQSKKQGRKM